MNNKSPLRRYLIAYAQGHNNLIITYRLELAGYGKRVIRALLAKMTIEGVFTRLEKGRYKLND